MSVRGLTKEEYMMQILIDKYKRECHSCGLSQWFGNDIPLQLDYINENHKDKRIENLQLLCRNCYCAKYNRTVDT